MNKMTLFGPFLRTMTMLTLMTLTTFEQTSEKEKKRENQIVENTKALLTRLLPRLDLWMWNISPGV
jgi:hypothetical protein